MIRSDFAVVRVTPDAIFLIDLDLGHAEERGISVNELMRRLADVIADDALVDSVLDDREGEAA